MKKLFLLALLLGLCGFASLSDTVESISSVASPEMTSSKTNYILMIIPQYNFPDDEYTIPKVILSRAGYTVEVASQSTREIAIGTDIIKVRPNFSIEQINPDRYDALIMVGGYLSKKFYENPTLEAKVKEFNAKGKLIGAMDNMPYYLAKWGILKGIKATINPGMAKDLKKMGINYVDKDIVIDQNIITVDIYRYSDQFANDIVEELGKR